MVQLEILLPTKHYKCHFQCHIKCSKCPPLTCTHAFRRLVKSLTALFIGSCGMLSHINCKAAFSPRDHLWLRLQFVIPFQHGPHVIVKGVEIWEIWWPMALLNDLRTVCVQPLLCDTCRVCWSAILLESEPGWHQLLAVLDKLRKQSRNVIQSVNFCLFVDEMEPTFTLEADPSRHHNVFCTLFPLDQQAAWLDVGLLFS